MTDMHYYETIVDQSVFLLGVGDPAWNGFSVHIERVRQRLIKQRNVVYLFRLEKRKKLCFLLMYQVFLWLQLMYWRPSTVICFAVDMESDLAEFAVLVRWKRFFPFHFIWVVHNNSCFEKLSCVEKDFVQANGTSVDQFIDLGKRLSAGVLRSTLPITRCKSDSEYIKPSLVSAAAIMREYPIDVRTFLKVRNPIIMIGSTSQNVRFRVAQKEMDHLVYVVELLRKYYEHIGILWGIGYPLDLFSYHFIYQCFFKSQLQEHLFLFANQQPIWPLLRHVHLFLWPSAVHHDTLVKEALFCNTPTIISSEAQECPGAIIYQKNDAADCVAKMLPYLPVRSRRKVLYEPYTISEQNGSRAL